MTNNGFKLIIWDFDGVIADSEKIWLANREKFFRERLGVDWDFEQINKLFGGMADKTKKLVLDELGYKTDDKFWQDVLELDVAYMKEKGIEKFDGVEDILKDKRIKQCVATGGTRLKTKMKTDIIGLDEYIPFERVYTVDFVEKGKPAPDLFLYAAEQMGEKPENCLIVEDSIAGMTAGLRAGMTVAAFLGSEIYHNQEYVDKVKALGIKHIFYNMADLYDFIKINI